MTGQVDRTRVSFESGGEQITGYLYRAPESGGDLPGIVMATGFGGTQDTPSIIANAGDFAAAGFAVLTFDYRSFGESEGEPRQVVNIKDQLADIHAAIRYLRSRPGVDPQRIALWGTSLGGGHVITAAAQDPRIAAVVAQVPFNGFPKQVEGRSAELTRRLLSAMFADTLRGWLGRSPGYIPAVGGPQELAVMSSQEAEAVIAGMQSQTWQNRVAPRALVEMMFYKPGAVVSRLNMPLLVSTGEYDKETQGDTTGQLAQDAPRGELKSYPVAHFDFYRPEIRKQITADQIAFLRQHLGEPRKEPELAAA